MSHIILCSCPHTITFQFGFHLLAIHTGKDQDGTRKNILCGAERCRRSSKQSGSAFHNWSCHHCGICISELGRFDAERLRVQFPFLEDCRGCGKLFGTRNSGNYLRIHLSRNLKAIYFSSLNTRYRTRKNKEYSTDNNNRKKQTKLV